MHSHVSIDVGGFIQEVVARIEPTTSLEVGMAYGVSTLFILDALAKLNKPVELTLYGRAAFVLGFKMHQRSLL